MSKPRALMSPEQQVRDQERHRRYYETHREKMLGQAKAAQQRRAEREPDHFRVYNREYYRAQRSLYVAQVWAIIEPLMEQLTVPEIVKHLDTFGVALSRRKRWTATKVHNIIAAAK